MTKQYPLFKASYGGKQTDAERIFKKLSETNRKAIDKHILECSVNCKSKGRQDNRKRSLTRFLSFLGKDYNKMNYDDYVLAAKALSESKLGVHARNFEKDVIKRFLRESFDDWQMRFKNLRLLKLESKNGDEKLTNADLLTELELDKLLKATPNLKYKCLIVMLYQTACRPEEILKLRWSDIDFKASLVYFYSNKTRQRRPVPIRESLQHLKRLQGEILASPESFIFTSPAKETPLTNSGLNYLLKNLSAKAGLKKKIYPYIFRHTRLSFLITRLSPKVYEEVAGHSLAMGMKTYAHLSQDAIKREMLEKVFEVEEIPADKQEEFEKEIKELKEREERTGKLIAELWNKLLPEGEKAEFGYYPVSEINKHLEQK